jgi:hypothetical protein
MLNLMLLSTVDLNLVLPSRVELHHLLPIMVELNQDMEPQNTDINLMLPMVMNTKQVEVEAEVTPEVADVTAEDLTDLNTINHKLTSKRVEYG